MPSYPWPLPQMLHRWLIRKGHLQEQVDNHSLKRCSDMALILALSQMTKEIHIHSSIHPFIHSVGHWFVIHPFICSFTHSFTQLLNICGAPPMGQTLHLVLWPLMAERSAYYRAKFLSLGTVYVSDHAILCLGLTRVLHWPLNASSISQLLTKDVFGHCQMSWVRGETQPSPLVLEDP
jgi:hypothetical protein